MKIAIFFLLASFLCSGASPLFGAIDLMAMKKQEDERRKKIAKSKIAVSDTNVNTVVVAGKTYGFVQMESDEPAPAEDVAAGPTGGKDERGDITKQPDYWQKQLADLQQRIAKLKEDIDSGQLELNKLWSDFYIKNIAAEQDAIKVQISQLTNQIEQKKLFLSQSETQLDDLYEKARKAGVPPGWLR